MKTKHFLTTFSVLSALITVTRILQYFLITDSEGYFVLNNIASQILSWSVYALLVAGGIIALVANFATSKEQADFNGAVGTKSIGIMFITSATLIMIVSGITLSSSSFKIILPVNQAQIPNILNIVSAVFGIVCSIYFALIGIMQTTNKSVSVPSGLGIFPPLYFALLGISEFYMSFGRANQSSTKLFMVSICSLALFTMTLSLVFCKAEASRGRVIASAGIVALSTAATGIPTILSMLFGKTAFDASWLINALIHIVFMLIAYIVLIRMSFSKQDSLPDEIEPIEFSTLDKYLNEIPDEDRGNDEQ